MPLIGDREVARGRKTIRVTSEASSRSVRSRILVSGDLRKYFRSDSFVTHYDADLVLDPGVLSIPALSMILPVAWLTGADVFVDELDATFARSMPLLVEEYGKMYPRVGFRSELHVENPVESMSAPPGTALLFTGGLDSTHTLMSHLADRPTLVTILGTDVPYGSEACRDMVRPRLLETASRVDVGIRFIRTNGLEILRRRRLDHLCRRRGRIPSGHWVGIGHSLGHVGQLAPLSTGRFDRILVSSTIDAARGSRFVDYPDASHPETDELIAWSSVRVEHSEQSDRLDKSCAVADFLQEHGLSLRVCGAAAEHLLRMGVTNCSRCEKCLRTMVGLALAGVDPAKHGFRVDSTTNGFVRGLFERRLVDRKMVELFWEPFQERLRRSGVDRAFGLEAFLLWFGGQDLEAQSRPGQASLSARDLYYRLPYPIAEPARRLLFDPLKRSTSMRFRHWLGMLTEFAPFGRARKRR